MIHGSLLYRHFDSNSHYECSISLHFWLLLLEVFWIFKTSWQYIRASFPLKLWEIQTQIWQFIPLILQTSDHFNTISLKSIALDFWNLFFKQAKVCHDQIWTENLMHGRPLSYPLDHFICWKFYGFADYIFKNKAHFNSNTRRLTIKLRISYEKSHQAICIKQNLKENLLVLPFEINISLMLFWME